MRIHSFSKVLALPIGVAFALILFFSMEYNNHVLSYWLIPCVVILVAIYIFSPQIDYWWYKDHPPPLEKPILKWLNDHHFYYNSLPETQQKRFKDRLSVVIKAMDFSMMAPEQTEMPEDLKAIIASNAVQLTFGLDQYLFRHFERVVAYRHAFPSPDHPELHTVETQIEDGVIVLSLDHLIPAMLNPAEYYNICLHAFTLAFIHERSVNLPDEILDIPDDVLKNISGMSMQNIRKFIGLQDIDRGAVVIHHFLQYPKAFLQKLPDTYQYLTDQFNEMQPRSKYA